MENLGFPVGMDGFGNCDAKAVDETVQNILEPFLSGGSSVHLTLLMEWIGMQE